MWRMYPIVRSQHSGGLDAQLPAASGPTTSAVGPPDACHKSRQLPTDHSATNAPPAGRLDGGTADPTSAPRTVRPLLQSPACAACARHWDAAQRPRRLLSAVGPEIG